MAMTYGQNTTAVIYKVENQSNDACSLTVDPFVKFGPKETAIKAAPNISFSQGKVMGDKYTLHISTTAALRETPVCSQMLAYPEDSKDGRPGQGVAACVCRAEIAVESGQTREFSIIFASSLPPRRLYPPSCATRASWKAGQASGTLWRGSWQSAPMPLLSGGLPPMA